MSRNLVYDVAGRGSDYPGVRKWEDLTSANFHNFLNDPFLQALEFGAYES